MHPSRTNMKRICLLHFTEGQKQDTRAFARKIYGKESTGGVDTRMELLINQMNAQEASSVVFVICCATKKNFIWNNGKTENK